MTALQVAGCIWPDPAELEIVLLRLLENIGYDHQTDLEGLIPSGRARSEPSLPALGRGAAHSRVALQVPTPVQGFGGCSRLPFYLKNSWSVLY